MREWQLISNDQVWFFPPDIQLSTTKVLNFYYESCLFFANGDSDVVSRYSTQEEALAGHVKLEKKYGLKRCLRLTI